MTDTLIEEARKVAIHYKNYQAGPLLLRMADRIEGLEEDKRPLNRENTARLLAFISTVSLTPISVLAAKAGVAKSTLTRVFDPKSPYLLRRKNLRKVIDTAEVVVHKRVRLNFGKVRRSLYDSEVADLHAYNQVVSVLLVYRDDDVRIFHELGNNSWVPLLRLMKHAKGIQ
tara:strand:+ start:1016 stop:1528 length:513 start_codon:yes stop_codon:yes gene_type:complete